VTFVRPVTALAPGDHACLVYDDEERRDELLLSYANSGLGRGERVICLSDAISPALVEALERSAGPGQLRFARASEAFFPEGSGSFAPDHVLRHWRKAVESSVMDGFGVVRAAGEPPHALTSNGSGASLVDYERQANELFTAGNFVGLCLYDLRETDPRTLIGLVEAHPIVLYAVAPDSRLRVEEPATGQLVLSGWIDVTTLGGLADRLTALAVESEGVKADLENVDFIDVTGLRLFVEAASRLHERGHTLTLAQPPDWVPSVMRVLGYDDREGLVLE
jgi:anti-anti-sigma factor